MIYMCSVYSLNADAELMQKRYEYAMAHVYNAFMSGIALFSPIVHCHEVSSAFKMPKTWEFWQIIDYKFIDACDSIQVLLMPGWAESVGVSAEIEYAKKLGKSIKYVQCNDYSE